jgi:hypothetical protein
MNQRISRLSISRKSNLSITDNKIMIFSLKEKYYNYEEIIQYLNSKIQNSKETDIIFK